MQVMRDARQQTPTEATEPSVWSGWTVDSIVVSDGSALFSPGPVGGALQQVVRAVECAARPPMPASSKPLCYLGPSSLQLSGDIEMYGNLGNPLLYVGKVFWINLPFIRWEGLVGGSWRDCAASNDVVDAVLLKRFCEISPDKDKLLSELDQIVSTPRLTGRELATRLLVLCRNASVDLARCAEVFGRMSTLDDQVSNDDAMSIHRLGRYAVCLESARLQVLVCGGPEAEAKHIINAAESKSLTVADEVLVKTLILAEVFGVWDQVNSK